MGFYYHYERWLKGEETTSSYKFVRVIISRIRAIGRLTCSLHDGCLNALKTALMVHKNTYSCFWMEPNLQDSWVYSLHTHHAPILLNCSFVLGFILVASVFCSFITKAKWGHACAVIEGIREDVHLVSICTVLENCYCISHVNIFCFYDVLQIICCNMFVCCWGVRFVYMYLACSSLQF